MVTRTSGRAPPRPAARAIQSRPAAAQSKAPTRRPAPSTRSAFTARATPGTALGRPAPRPNTRLTAGVSPSEARARLAQERAPARGQSLTAAARRRTALENDARARPATARSTSETEVTSGLTGASVSRKRTLPEGPGGQGRSVEAGASFDSTQGTGKGEVSANRTAPSLGRKREGGSLDDETIARNRRRDAVDRIASVEVATAGVERGGSLLARTVGDERTGASVRVGEATANATGAVRVGAGTARVDGKAGAELNLVRADATLTTRVGGRELQLKAEGRIGAQANANGSIVFDPRRGEVRVGAGGDVFAGARAGVSGSYEILPGIRVGGEAEGRAGIGAGASLDAGLRRGTFRFKGSLSATLGLGGKLGGNVEINPGQTIAAARRASPGLDAAIRTGQRLATSAPVRRATQAVQRTGAQAISTGRQLLRTAETAGASALRRGRELSSQALDSGRRLAARAQGAFRSFFSAPPSPQRRLVSSAMARAFGGL